MTWNGEKVARELGITGHQGEGRELYGLAYRRNPKRAHLLVSTVLGKHIPQSPREILSAMHALGDKVKNHLSPGEEITVFGYAETAVSMGAAIADYLEAPYLHSTRYPRAGTEYGAFSEEHSHATSHSIHLRDNNLLNDSHRGIVLVDDELSTGNTIINTIKAMEEQSHHEHYIVATLTDMRTMENRGNLQRFADEIDTKIHVVSLLELHLDVPEDSLERAKSLLPNLNGGTPIPNPTRGGVQMLTVHLPRPVLHAGVTASELHSMGEAAKDIGATLSSHTNSGSILVLAVEEEMYLPLKIAEGLEQTVQRALFSSSTLSPVLPHEGEDYAIQSAITYRIADEALPRYAYNILQEEYGNIILVANGEQELRRLRDLIAQLAPLTENLIVINLEGEHHDKAE